MLQQPYKTFKVWLIQNRDHISSLCVS